MIETVEHPSFRPAGLRSRKKPGLSAMVVLKNEEEFAAVALESILPFFDEIVVVINGCTDRTPEIVEGFAERNPDRVRAFHYVPKVYSRGSMKHRREPPTSVHSLVHYMNFALSRTSYQIVCKWDGDQIASPLPFGNLVERLRRVKPGTVDWWLSPWQLGCWWYTGVNLYERDGGLYVVKKWPVIGTKHDHRIWPSRRWVFFKRYRESAYLFTRLLLHRYVGTVFYHLKGLKRDRGLGNLARDGSLSAPMAAFVEGWTNPELITFEQYQATAPAPQRLPAPETVGIRPTQVSRPGRESHGQPAT